MYTGNTLTDTLASSVDPDEMPHKVTFHQGLHCLQRKKQYSGTEIHLNLKLWPLDMYNELSKTENKGFMQELAVLKSDHTFGKLTQVAQQAMVAHLGASIMFRDTIIYDAQRQVTLNLKQ